METRKTSTVVILGPPWPHSGTARVIENQIDFYRNRGYATIFITVPIDCWYVESYPQWREIQEGMEELGADQTFVAPINHGRFLRQKYSVWIRRAFRPTALDWIQFTSASAELPKEAMQAIREARVDLVQVNHVFTLGFAEKLLGRVIERGNRLPVILETHDVQAHLLNERGEINQWTHKKDTMERLLDSEYSSLRKARVLVHCSEEDLEFFKSNMPDMEHVLALPTIDDAFVSSVPLVPPDSKAIDLLFVGQSTGPNLAGIKWFLEEVWPLIAKRGYRVSLVGKIAFLVEEHLPELYDRFRSLFVGPVAELGPYYAAARCVIAPMMSGTGISIKTVEALALGKPFVGTAKAYRGMPADRLAAFGLRAHDTPQAFAIAISNSLSNPAKAAAASRQAYEALFSRQASFLARDEALRIATTR